MKKVAFQLPISVILFIAVCNFIARNKKRKQQRWVFPSRAEGGPLGPTEAHLNDVRFNSN